MPPAIVSSVMKTKSACKTHSIQLKFKFKYKNVKLKYNIMTKIFEKEKI